MWTHHHASRPAKAFGFLSLPYDVRYIVYSFLLSREGYLFPLHVDPSGVDKPQFTPIPWAPYDDSENPNIEVSILRTCHQVNEEASRILYRMNRFIVYYKLFDNEQRLLSDNPNGPANVLSFMRQSTRKMIRHLTLTIDNPITVSEMEILKSVVGDPQEVSVTATAPTLSRLEEHARGMWSDSTISDKLNSFRFELLKPVVQAIHLARVNKPTFWDDYEHPEVMKLLADAMPEGYTRCLTVEGIYQRTYGSDYFSPFWSRVLDDNLDIKWEEEGLPALQSAFEEFLREE